MLNTPPVTSSLASPPTAATPREQGCGKGKIITLLALAILAGGGAACLITTSFHPFGASVHIWSGFSARLPILIAAPTTVVGSAGLALIWIYTKYSPEAAPANQPNNTSVSSPTTQPPSTGKKDSSVMALPIQQQRLQKPAPSEAKKNVQVTAKDIEKLKEVAAHPLKVSPDTLRNLHNTLVPLHNRLPCSKAYFTLGIPQRRPSDVYRRKIFLLKKEGLDAYLRMIVPNEASVFSPPTCVLKDLDRLVEEFIIGPNNRGMIHIAVDRYHISACYLEKHSDGFTYIMINDSVGSYVPGYVDKVIDRLPRDNVKIFSLYFPRQADSYNCGAIMALDAQFFLDTPDFFEQIETEKTGKPVVKYSEGRSLKLAHDGINLELVSKNGRKHLGVQIVAEKMMYVTQPPSVKKIYPASENLREFWKQHSATVAIDTNPYRPPREVSVSLVAAMSMLKLYAELLLREYTPGSDT